jgi:hypothetical protein
MLEFMRRLFEVHMLFSTLNIYFKVELLQITSRLGVQPLTVIYTNHQ